MKETIVLPLYIFSEVAILIRAGFEEKLQELGLHSGQIFVLNSLFEKDGQNQKELADRLNLSSPTVFKMVKSLTSNGFVKCRKCSRDARARRVFLTEKAINQKTEIIQTWMESNSYFFKSLTETEKLIFFQLLEKIKEDLTG
ncbi:MAG: MarR family transcriptional regulator [Pyrinomonadaceae bacterium]